MLFHHKLVKSFKDQHLEFRKISNITITKEILVPKIKSEDPAPMKQIKICFTTSEILSYQLFAAN